MADKSPVDLIPDYERYSNQIVREFTQEMKKELNLICIGDGGKMPYDVEVISVTFMTYRRATIEEARELEVKATERLIQLVNNHEKIRPFLREYPIKANRAHVSISFSKKDNSDYTDGSVAYVSQAKNKIIYRRADAKEKLIILAEEPYEEALKIVQKSK